MKGFDIEWGGRGGHKVHTGAQNMVAGAAEAGRRHCFIPPLELPEGLNTPNTG